MYFCPLSDCGNTETFIRDVAATITETVGADGEILSEEAFKHERRSHVRCGKCQARAEWRDQRQLEMFAAEPEMFPS